MNGEEARQGLPTHSGKSPARDDSSTSGGRQRRALTAAAFDAVRAARTSSEERELAARFKAAKDHPCGAPRFGTGDEIARLSTEIDALWESRRPLRDRAREAVERLVEWHELRALATIDLRAMRTAALEAVRDELRQRTSIDEVVALLRRTDVPPRENRAAA